MNGTSSKYGSVFPLGDVMALDKSDIHLSVQPLGDGEDVYVRNPYANCYVSIKDSDLLNTFVQAKSYAIKEALVKMGAKDIVMRESVHDKDTHRYEVNNNMGVKVVKAEINGKHENDFIDLFVKCKDVETKKKVLEAIKKYAKWENTTSIALRGWSSLNREQLENVLYNENNFSKNENVC